MSNPLIAAAAGHEFATRERCHITELLNSAAVPEVSLALCRVEPGVTTELHRLRVAEWYVIRDGHGEMRVGEAAPFAVGPGDAVAIPAGSPQQVRNVGDADLLIECVCMPRFTPDAYEALEADPRDA